MNFSGICQCRLRIVPGVVRSPGISMERQDGLVDPELCFVFFFPSRQVRWKYNERSWKLPLERHVMDNEVCMHAQPLTCVQLFATPWTVAHQAPLSIRFSRQEYWSGCPCPPSGDLPNPGIKSKSLALASRCFTTSASWEAQ